MGNYISTIGVSQKVRCKVAYRQGSDGSGAAMMDALAVIDVAGDEFRFGTPQWDEARAKRRGNPTGSHIRHAPADEEVSAFEGPDFAAAVKHFFGRYNEGEPVVQTQTGWLPSDWGTSNTLTLRAMAAGFRFRIFTGYNT